MDIGHEVRRYRAEPLTSPVPGAAPAPAEPALPRHETDEGADATTTREVAAEARA